MIVSTEVYKVHAHCDVRAAESSHRLSISAITTRLSYPLINKQKENNKHTEVYCLYLIIKLLFGGNFWRVFLSYASSIFFSANIQELLVAPPYGFSDRSLEISKCASLPSVNTKSKQVNISNVIRFILWVLRQPVWRCSSSLELKCSIWNNTWNNASKSTGSSRITNKIHWSAVWSNFS